MRFLRRALGGIFLLALTFALLAQAGRIVWTAVEARMNEEPPSFPQRERELSVNTVAWAPRTISPQMTVFGDIRSSRTLSVRATSGGTVVEVGPAFAEGGRVAAGELLVRIDPTEAEAAVMRARAGLADAEAELRDALRAVDLDRDELDAAERQAGFRNQALQRQRDLADRGVGTTPDLEAAELAAAGAEQAILSARAAIAASESRIDQARSLIARSEIDLAEAERTLADTEIRAAFDGVLSGVAAVQGGRVTPNEQIAELIDPAALEVSFRLSTAQHGVLLGEDGDFIGTPVSVSLDVAGLSLTAPGRIIREGAGVEAGQTGRVVFAEIDAGPGLRPGDFVTVTITEPALADVVDLPASALAADGTVLVVDAEQRLAVLAVDLLRRQGDSVIVRADVAAGTLVVAERSPLLGAGILVRPIDPGAAAAEPEAAMIELTEERRARLVAFVEGNGQIPEEAKTRILAQLGEPLVPSEVVSRLESRMGS